MRALWTSSVTSPVASTAAATEAGSVTSIRTGIAPGRSTDEASRAPAETLAPRSSSSAASARPKPRLAPVTRAVVRDRSMTAPVSLIVLPTRPYTSAQPGQETPSGAGTGQQAALDGDHHRARPVVDAELGEDSQQVRLDRRLTDEQFPPDLGVRQPTRHAAQPLQLPGRRRLDRGGPQTREQPRGDRRRQHRLPPRGRAH